MDISDEEKFLFVINSFEADKKNEIAGPDIPSIGETIPRISEEILENIETINEGEESKIVEAVKNNIDKFSRKTLTILKAQDGKLFLKSVK